MSGLARTAVFGLAGLSVAWLAVEAQAAPSTTEKLVKSIEAACKPVTPALARTAPVGADGVIAPRDLRIAIGSAGVATLPYDPDMSPEALASRAFKVKYGDPEMAGYTNIRGLAEAWTNPNYEGASLWPTLERGGVRVVKVGGQLSSVEAEAVLGDILRGRSASYLFYCKVGKQEHASPPEPAPPLDWAIARSPDGLGAKLDKKKFAEFAYVRNEVKDDQSYSVYGTLGVTGRMIRFPVKDQTPGQGVTLDVYPSAFIQVEREASSAGGDKVNNINFGGQLSGRVEVRDRRTFQHYYSVSLRYLTDDSLESSAWSLSARLTPDFLLPAQGLEEPVGRMRFLWSLSGVADAMEVDDPGDKAAFLTVKQYQRVGYDLDGHVRWLLSDGEYDGAVRLAASYKLRDDFSDNRGDAQLFSIGLTFEPSPYLAVGVVYDRGENLDSLEFNEQWRFSIGVRR